MSFLDAVGCVNDDLCVAVLPFEALWLILFKLDVDERPEFEPGDIVWELLLEASESFVVSGFPLRER